MKNIIFEQEVFASECRGPVIAAAPMVAGAAGGSTTLVTALKIGSTVLGALGSMQQNRAQEAHYKAQEQAALYNARINEQNARIARQQTQANLEKADRERRIRVGQRIAGSAASSTGIESFGDIMASSAAQEKLDLLTIESEGLLKERSFLNNATLNRGSAAGYRTQASSSNNFLGVGSALLGGVASAIA